MLTLVIRLSALSFGLCYATLPSSHLPPSQVLTSLNERMNEMINALYESSPVLAKLKASAAAKSPEPTTTTETPPAKNEYEQYYQMPIPISTPMVYVPSVGQPQKTLEAGMQPVDFAYPSNPTNPMPRSVLSPLSYPMPTPYPTVPYPCEYPHSYPEYPVYPTPYLPPGQFPSASPVFAPCPAPAPAPFPPSTSYSPAMPSYSPPVPSYSPAGPSYPMTSYQPYPTYQNSAQPNYPQACNYSPPPQGESNAPTQQS